MDGDGTRVVRAGLPDPVAGEPFLPGPVFAAPFHLPGDPAGAAFQYGRYDNPTWRRLEAAIGELEGGDALVFASGMAAITAVLWSLLRPDDTLVMPADGYYTARGAAEEDLAAAGVRVVTVPTASPDLVAAVEGATLIMLETPSNPRLDVCDIAAVCAAARRSGAIVAVDNSTATPLGQRPLALGAHLSVASDTKAMSGHADLVLGHVASADAALLGRIRAWRTRTGGIVGPFEAWLAHRSLATLALRLDRQCANALAVAELLHGAPAVSQVRYPGLPHDPGHAVAARQMRRFGPIVSFELDDRAAAERFLASARLVHEASSFGGVHSSAERRGRWGGDDVAEGLIRFSAGIEDTADLVADVRSALAATAPG